MKKPTIDELYSAYAGKVYAVCMSYLKNPQDAEDITQDTFVAAMRKLHSLKNPQKAQAWLCKIAANKCKNYLKKSKPELVADESDLDGGDVGNIGYAVSPESAVIDESMRQSVRNIVDDLPDAQKAVICGFYFDCKSIKELSRQLNCKQNTVKSILHRSRKSIREECDKRGVTLNGISVGAALSSCANVIPTAVKSAAGAIAAKITAGVLAAAVAAYGIIGVCIYSGRDNYSDYCDVYDGSRKISTEPLKISDVRFIGDPVDRTNDYEAVPIDEVSEKLSDICYDFDFIDNDRLFVVTKQNEIGIYNFATDTFTPIDFGDRIPKIDAQLQTAVFIQYKAANDYWLVLKISYIGCTDFFNDYAVHFKYDNADEIVDITSLIRTKIKTDENQYAINAYSKKIVNYTLNYTFSYRSVQCSNTITVSDFDGNSKTIELPYYITHISWLNDEWIEIACKNKISYFESDETAGGEPFKCYIIRLNTKTEQTVITDYKHSIDESTSDSDDEYYQNSFYPDLNYYDNGDIGFYRFVFSKSGENVPSAQAVLDLQSNSFIRCKFRNDNTTTARSRGEYIYTYTWPDPTVWAFNRYNFHTEKYETVAVFPNGGNGFIASPSGERIIVCLDLLHNPKYYLVSPKSE